jgi:hypothetical protein
MMPGTDSGKIKKKWALFPGDKFYDLTCPNCEGNDFEVRSVKGKTMQVQCCSCFYFAQGDRPRAI